MKRKFLWQHKSGRIYVRINGNYFPIKAAEGTEEFDREYWEIRNGKRAEAKRSWEVLIDHFRRGDEWANFSPRYRKDLEPVFAFLIANIGKSDVSRLTQADIYDAMDANAHRVRFANYIPTAISMLSTSSLREVIQTGSIPAWSAKRATVILRRGSAHLRIDAEMSTAILRK